VIGRSLAQYRVTASIGAGGMGEVYRARDTKLGRDVALKVVSEGFTHDPERAARFRREAQLLAALNHPHIAAIYGLEHAADTNFLVLELVDGETLAERIAHGPLPLSAALAIAGQIADALQAAHDKGIIHRDLKPANIALTADGQVKVLDFGLAKAMEGAPASSSSLHAATLSPTISLAMTEAGMILGTAAYMSPEQAKGRPADKRADVWAFGCVLFEMLTGKRAFEGEDASDTLAAVLRGEPDWKALPRATPAHVRTILHGCLEKDRKTRLADISVVNYLLRDPGQARRTVARSWDRRTRLALAAGAAAIAVVSVVATWWLARPRPEPAQPTRFAIVLGADQQLGATTTDRQVAISPDGRALVYVATQGRLMLRPADRLDVQPLPGIIGARIPFWSPDSRWIGFFDGNNDLRKVSATGGPPIPVTKTGTPPRGATWTSDERIIFATSDQTTGLLAVPAGGGEPQVLTKPDLARAELDHLFPSILPGGRAVLFTITPRGGTPDNAQVAALTLATGEYTTLVRGGSHAEYVDTGHLVYAAAGTLRAVRFDPDRLQVLSDPVPVLEQVRMVASGVAEYAISRTGALVYVPGSSTGSGDERRLVWVNRQGREEAIPAPARAYTYPRISPDGTRLALDIRDQENDIWTWDLARPGLTRLTVDGGQDRWPIWTPDGRAILFSAEAGTVRGNVFRVSSDGVGAPERLTTSSSDLQFPNSIDPEGTRLVFRDDALKTARDLWLLMLDGKSKPQLLIQTGFNEENAEISPNGRWLAYQSTESGEDEVYVRPFPDVNAGGKWKISPAGGSRPAWNRNGRELFYLDADNRLNVVTVRTDGPAFIAGNPTRVFDTVYAVPQTGRTYDVSPDGRRFLMIKEEGGAGLAAAPPVAITVVLDWVEELKARLPAP